MILEKVKRHISDNRLLNQGAVVIVGLSGGADSMALLDILVRLRYRCVAAHCNFHLRGEESDEDARFAETWCLQQGVDFVSTDFDTVRYAADRKISIEMAARDLRYHWFEEIRIRFGADAIAVAHHKDDSVETVLLNLVRGTGISGLRGILPKNGKVVRPLLCVDRDEIENYLESGKIPFRTDSTNEEGIYRRNFIRLNILPAFKLLNPSVADAISRTASNLAEVEKVYRHAIGADISNVLNGDKINIDKLRKSVSPQALLYEIMSPLGFSPSVIDDAMKSLDAESGRQFFSKTHRIIKDRDCFIIDEILKTNDLESIFFISEEDTGIEVPILLEIQKLEIPVEIDKSSNCLYVDTDKLSFPLILRKWKSGDWLIPFGMQGKKKVSDYFTDQKLSLKEKEEAWLLFSGENLVWIVGHRSDDQFKVGKETSRVLKIKWKST